MSKKILLAAAALLLSGCPGWRPPEPIRYPGVPSTLFVPTLCRLDAGLGVIPKKPNEYFSPDGSFFLRWIKDPDKAYFGPKSDWCRDRTTGSGTTLIFGGNRCRRTSVISRVIRAGKTHTPRQLFEMELEELRNEGEVEFVTGENVATRLGPAYLAVIRLHGSDPCSTYHSKGVITVVNGPEVYLMGYWLQHGNYAYRLSHQEAETKTRYDRSMRTYVPVAKTMDHVRGFRRHLDSLLDIFHPSGSPRE